MTIEIRPLGSADRSAFIAVMADAFAEDPLIVAILGGRAGLSTTFLSFMFDMTALLGGCRRGLFVDGRLVGCMLLEPPERRGPSGWLRLTLAALRFIPVALRLPARSTRLLNRYLVETRAAAPAVPHAYLTMIGVERQSHGRGYGRRLIETAIGMAATLGGRGLALDTENPANVPLYESFGFGQTARLDLGAFTSFCMYRPSA